MSYPITATVFARRHTGGTKDYYAVLLTTDNAEGSNALVITRYGKAGAWGAPATVKYMTLSSATMAFQKKCREKAGRDYSRPINNDGTTRVCHNVHELNATIGERYLHDMNRDDRLHLFGSDDVAITPDDKELEAMVEADAKLAAEGERRREEEAARRKAEKEETARLAREAEEAESTRRSIAKNQTWGMF